MTKQEKLIQATIKYYRGEETGMTDKEYDALCKEFPEIDIKKYSLLINGDTVSHSLPIVDRKKETVDPTYFQNKDYAQLNNTHWVTPKFDGSSVVAYYKDGILDRIVTRGDNESGKEKTISLFNKFPLYVDKEVTAIEGEAVTSIEYGRSKANGLVNSKDKQEEVDDLLVVFPFYVHTKSDKESYEKRFKMINKPIILFDNNEPTIEVDGIKYPIDGIVCYPKGDIHESDEGIEKGIFIYKYYYIEAIKTKVVDLDWKRSQYGLYVPTVVFEPIQFGDYTVQRASSGGIMNLLNNGIGIGSDITVIQSGLTIPKIHEVLSTKDVELPKCEICGKDTQLYNNECRCINHNCDSYKTESTHFNDILDEFAISGGLKFRFDENKEYNKETEEEFWSTLEENITAKKFATCILYKKALNKRLAK